MADLLLAASHKKPSPEQTPSGLISPLEPTSGNIEGSPLVLSRILDLHYQPILSGGSPSPTLYCPVLIGVTSYSLLIYFARVDLALSLQPGSLPVFALLLHWA
ncbi:hypothetical protein BHE90_004358 [Fusarium euwallaceae]|uniref:Uncharacterized protein n=3 Tax=Fusarium solani species complex TaxID=232080 RepID=A0A3M2SJ47_9HYPO|nr:hypothetical protein CDV36_003226 [Fusarium kuroshium]RSM10619.1 hypothetical protein CEP52_003520 [Fusarium oligoseptatum]RTE81137.1 hypothetical protein BHE90_004358 [Fusarium euwallaceae]